MKSIEIKELVGGLMAIALFTLAIGKFSKLAEFARKEAGKPMHNLATFFPSNYRSIY